MKIAVIHGQSHQGSTHHITEAFLKHFPEGEITHFRVNHLKACVGCYTCFLKGEDQCPHQEDIQPIVKAIEEADIIVADSPNYCMSMTGQLKMFFDHMAYRWISHRPHPSMRKKIGIAISSTAGIGAGGVTKSIAKQMFWWGISRTYRISASVSAMKWEEVKPKTLHKIEIKAQRIAKKAQKHLGKEKTGLKFGFLFKMMAGSQKSNTWNPLDKQHWLDNGWI